jgi:hypothetical protein
MVNQEPPWREELAGRKYRNAKHLLEGLIKVWGRVMGLAGSLAII